ncbi:hypothetical protein [Brevibacillus dissolubilis]|uniref:hypothetical protein n=1 Tax=Brevibacillus dissolubilis TaxID=1844116 RepID=UPI001116962D|nr:hypothetical protein [Brevibacillus dissolubilis]
MPIRNVRLTLWTGANFTGRRRRFRRRGVAVRNAVAINFNNVLTSFTLRGNTDFVTLVLFSGTNYQGNVRVFRGRTSVSNLANLGFNNVMSSFILVTRVLSDIEIAAIQLTRRAPAGVVEINT